MKALCLAHDPGGSKALGPVLVALREAGAECEVHASRFAAGWFESLGVPFAPLGDNLGDSEAARLFAAHPRLLLTGTSWASNAEQQARNQAERLGVPSVVCFDYWMNYAKRFDGAAYPVARAPDFIACADQGMAAEAAGEGFPRDRLWVTGHPYLDHLFRHRAELSAGSVASGAIFVSEDYPEELLRALPEPPLLAAARAYDAWLAARGEASGDFHVKLHPKESSNPFLQETLAAVRALPRLRFSLVEQASSLVHQLARYRIAFGYQSMALFEARALGLRVIAMPLRKGDAYPSLGQAMDSLGISRARPGQRELVNLLSAPAPAGVAANPYPGAVDALVARALAEAKR